MRLRLLLAPIVFSVSLLAHADTVTYDFTVTATSGPLVGQTASGSFSFDSSVIDPGNVVNGSNLLTSLDFTWNGTSYTAASANTGGLDFDASGQLIGFCFGNDYSLGNCGISLGTNDFFAYAGGFLYTTPGVREFDHGTITFELATTPEPSSLALLGTGMLGFAGILRKRFA